MANVREAFDQFLRRLELTTSEQTEASRQQNDLRDRLRGQLRGVVRDVLVGSYARKTAIRPLNDIDLFVVLDPAAWAARRTERPLLLLEDVQRVLRACYGSRGPTTTIQGRSVNIDFAGTGIGYDVIPAFALPPPRWAQDEVFTSYEIPDRKQGTWIKTNPESHRQRCVDANARAGGMLNQLIKAAKHWNRAQAAVGGDKPLRSFHLEVLAYNAFTRTPASVPIGLRDLFASLQSQVAYACPDPAGLGPALDADWSFAERLRAQQTLANAAAAAARAVELEQVGDHARAIDAWRGLLGPQFPR